MPYYRLIRTIPVLSICLLAIQPALALSDLTHGEVIHGELIRGELGSVDGRFEDRGAIRLEAAEVRWQLPPVSSDQPVSLQFWVRPLGWTGLSPEGVTIAKLKIGGDEWVMSKAPNRPVLKLTGDGVDVLDMPVYNWGDERWIRGNNPSPARWHHIAFEFNAGSLFWAVDGFVAGEVTLDEAPEEAVSLVLGGDIAIAYADLIVAGRSLGRGEDLRRTYRNSYNWQAEFPTTTVTIPHQSDVPGDLEAIGPWLREKGTQLPVLKRVSTRAGSNAVLSEPIKAYMAYSDQAIFMVIDTPFTGEADVREWPTRNSGNIAGEAYEIFFHPPWTGLPDYVQLAGNPRGDRIDIRAMDTSWMGEWEWMASIGDGFWEGLLVAPFAGLDFTPPVDGAVWTMNFYNGPAGACWSWVPLAFNNTALFGDLRFAKGPPLFRMEYPQVTENSIQVPLKIFGSAEDVALEVRLAYYLDGDILPVRETVEEKLLSKAESWSLDLRLEDLPSPEGMVALSVQRGEAMLYAQTFRIPAAPPQTRQAHVARSASESGEQATTLEETAEELDPRYRTEWTSEELGEFVLLIDEWQGNSLGYSDQVPSPWIPVTEEDGRIALWNRTYGMGGQLFPASIVSAGEELLSGPIQIVVRTESGEVRFSDAETSFEQKDDTRVEIQASARKAGLEVKTHHQVDFDGMIRTNLRIASDNPDTTYHGLHLEIPLRSEMVEGFHYIGEGGHPPVTDTGTVSKEGFVLDAFRSLVWLGNMDAGFTWFSESMKNWPLWNEDAIIELGTDDNGTRILRIKLGDRPFRLSAPLRLEFGFQATPLRPMPENFRWFTDSRLPMDWRWFRGDGQYILWHDFPELPREEILRIREGGREVMPVSSLRYYGRYYFDRNSFYELPTPGLARPEIFLWGDIWQNITSALVPVDSLPTLGANQVAPGTRWHGNRFDPKGLINLCPNSSFQDFYIWKLHTLIEETELGALYLDQATIRCANPYHRCGYVDYRGHWRTSTPHFAMREMMRRIYQLFYDKHGRTMIRWHSSNQLNIPSLSFVDIKWDGENYIGGPMTIQEFYSDLLKPDRMRFQHSGIPFGFAPDFLPVFSRARAPAPASSRDVAGYFMVHDSTVFPVHNAHVNLIRHIQHQRLRFPFKDAEVIHYWDEDPRIRIDQPEILYIAHPAPGQALVALFNHSDEPVSARLNLDLVGLGFSNPANLALEDFYFDHPLGEMDEQVRVDVGPRDFRMLRIFDTEADL